MEKDKVKNEKSACEENNLLFELENVSDFFKTDPNVFNFCSGPAMLARDVMAQAQKEFCNFSSSECGLLEMSHRSKPFLEILHETQKNIKELARLNDDFEVLFITGGASLQFAMLPMNFLNVGETADFIDSGRWSKMAYTQATFVGNSKIIASSSEVNYCELPNVKNLQNSKNSVYTHYCSNNTVFGTQFKKIPVIQTGFLACDMSSDIFSRELDLNQLDFIYAGLQKNLGPSGMSLVLIKRKLLQQCSQNIPEILRYSIFSENDNLYNTPNTFAIYLLNLTTKWIKSQGGIAGIEKINQKKAEHLYYAIDNSNNFYRGFAEKSSRSLMNICFSLPSVELEKLFIQKAERNGLLNLKGHRSVGGIRAAIYNAMPFAGVKKLVAFMNDFSKNNL